jgi:hypothetical protein
VADLDPAVVVDDLRTYLGLTPEAFDGPRAVLVVALAVTRAQAYLNPVPEAARAIILDVATRGFTNPTGTRSEAAGPFSRTFSTSEVYLTAGEREELLLLAQTAAGASRAFTITPGPAVTA